MKWNWLIVFFLAFCLLVGLLIPPATDTAVAAVYDISDWEYYKVITIDHDLIDTTLTNFPIMVVIDSTTGAKCDDGDSVRFIDFDGELLDYEIENWSSTGDSTVWVEVGTIWHSTDTQIYLYYNNTDASDAQNPSGVWDSSYSTVFHMNDSSGGLWDSTGTADANETGDPTYQQTGNFGYCVYYDGTGDYHNFTNALEGTAEATIELWYKADNWWTGSNSISLCGSWGDADSKRTVIVSFENTTKNMTVNFRDSAGASKYAQYDAGVDNNETWQYIAGRYENGDAVYAYKNETQYAGDSASNNIHASTREFHVAYDEVSAAFQGYIDEFRISTVARSNAWMQASFHAMNQTTGFIALGSETATADTGDEPYPSDVILESITYNGYISSTTMYLNYTDGMGETLNTHIVVREINSSTGTTAELGSNTTANNNNFQYTLTIDRSNEYYCLLYFNHTTFGFQTMTIFFVAPSISPITSLKDWLFNANYGGNPFGWSNIFMWVFLTACMFSFGQRGAGVSLTFTGGMFLFINNVIGFNTTLSTAAGGFIPIMFIVVGIMVLWRNAKKEGY